MTTTTNAVTGVRIVDGQVFLDSTEKTDYQPLSFEPHDNVTIIIMGKMNETNKFVCKQVHIENCITAEKDENENTLYLRRIEELQCNNLTWKNHLFSAPKPPSYFQTFWNNPLVKGIGLGIGLFAFGELYHFIITKK